MPKRKRLTPGQTLIVLPFFLTAILFTILSPPFFSPLHLLGYLIGGLGIVLALTWTRAEPLSVEALQASHTESWWKPYTEGVLKDLAANPTESDYFYRVYNQYGLAAVVSYMMRKDSDLTTEDANVIARNIIAEKYRPTQKAEENQKTVASNKETTATEERKEEKSWIEKWLQR